MEQHPEKRCIARRDFPYPVLIEFSEQEKGAFEAVQNKGLGVDISSQGIGILTDMSIDQGKVVKIYVPIGTPETMISSFSEVRWVKKADGRYRVGLNFIL